MIKQKSVLFLITFSHLKRSFGSSARTENTSLCYRCLIRPLFSSFLFPPLSIPPSPPPSAHLPPLSSHLTSISAFSFRRFPPMPPFPPRFSVNPLPHALYLHMIHFFFSLSISLTVLAIAPSARPLHIHLLSTSFLFSFSPQSPSPSLPFKG